MLIFTLLVIIMVIMVMRAMMHPGRWAMTSRTCPGCGEQLPGHAQYCRRCGQKL